MAKILGFIFVLAALVSGWFIYSQQGSTPEEVEEPVEFIEDVSQENMLTNDANSETEADIRDLAEELEAKVKIPQEQKELVKKQEKELLDLAAQYENVRDDSEKRLEHRQKMQEKLSQYNKDVLPIALEKIEAERAKQNQ